MGANSKTNGIAFLGIDEKLDIITNKDVIQRMMWDNHFKNNFLNQVSKRPNRNVDTKKKNYDIW